MLRPHILVHRLVLSALLPRLLAVLAASLTVFVVVELVDLSATPGGPPLAAYPLRLPLALVLVAPVALLGGGCWTGAHLARTGQIVGLAATGLDPRRALLALPVAAVLAGVLLYPTADRVSPRCLAAWSGPELPHEVPGRWTLSGNLLARVGAEPGEGGTWTTAFVLDDRGRPLERIRLELPPGPAHPGRSVPARHLTGRELAGAVAAARRSGADPSEAEAERGLRLALSLAAPVAMILGVVAGVGCRRRPVVAVLAAAAAALALWLVVSVPWILASSGRVHWLVAGLAPALFGPAAVFGWTRFFR